MNFVYGRKLYTRRGAGRYEKMVVLWQLTTITCLSNQKKHEGFEAKLGNSSSSVR